MVVMYIAVVRVFFKFIDDDDKDNYNELYMMTTGEKVLP